MKPLLALVVDDSILVRSAIKEIIKLCGGFVIFEASNGQIAVDTYKDVRPDLVFLDIVMPIRDGIDALIEIKAFDPQATVVIVSAVATHSQVKRAVQAGASDFVQKPWEQSRIISIVEKVKEKKRGM
ncbi:MAG: response regulator [Clostridia bacterium]|nr:response regulator [Clostridia bacterium]